MLETVEKNESNVRGYVRLFPTVFEKAQGSELWDSSGNRFIDFFCGAGTLNYGHNNPRVKQALLSYIQADGIQHSLDTATTAKISFLESLEQNILAPRGMDHRVQFTGPTGTNAVEAALKLAKLVKQRSHVIAFTNAYHGHSLGALALTGNSYYHSEYFGSRNNVSHLPFDGYHSGLNSADLLEQMLEDSSSGVPIPAAIILETVQGEGGLNVASPEWLHQVQEICRRRSILLIVDDIQVGNGRTGAFFSFEHADISPDMICLSKSIGGGLPMSCVLVKPEYDQWKPGQHTGTFRGNNLAFVAAAALLEYWQDEKLAQRIKRLASVVSERLDRMHATRPDLILETRGRGMIQGLRLASGFQARKVIDTCFENGLLLEASGPQDEVLKVMPALTIDEEILHEGLDVLQQAIESLAQYPQVGFAAINESNCPIASSPGAASV